MSIGDHIRALQSGRWVHGIDCGDRTVICFSTGTNGAPGLQRVHLSELPGGSAGVQVVTHTERVFPPKMVVARAFSRLRESAFSQMFSDSEQFATWCKSGRLGQAAGFGASGVASTPAKVQAAAPQVRRGTKRKPARRKASPPARAKPPRRTSKARSKAKPAPRAKAAATKASSAKKAGKAGKAVRARAQARRRR